MKPVRASRLAPASNGQVVLVSVPTTVQWGSKVQLSESATERERAAESGTASPSTVIAPYNSAATATAATSASATSSRPPERASWKEGP